MICALLIGREGSYGFPGKNLLNVLWDDHYVPYPMIAAPQNQILWRSFMFQ